MAPTSSPSWEKSYRKEGIIDRQTGSWHCILHLTLLRSSSLMSLMTACYFGVCSPSLLFPFLPFSYSLWHQHTFLSFLSVPPWVVITVQFVIYKREYILHVCICIRFQVWRRKKRWCMRRPDDVPSHHRLSFTTRSQKDSEAHGAISFLWTWHPWKRRSNIGSLAVISQNLFLPAFFFLEKKEVFSCSSKPCSSSPETKNSSCLIFCFSLSLFFSLSFLVLLLNNFLRVSLVFLQKSSHSSIFAHSTQERERERKTFCLCIQCID